MKALFLTLCSVLALCSCSTLPNGNVVVAGTELTPAVVQRDLAVAAKFGTREGLRADPEHARAYFQAAAAVLNASLDGGLYDPGLLKSALGSISVKELQDPSISEGLQALVELYAGHVGAMVGKNIDEVPYLRSMLTGLRDGIEAGLTQ